MEKISFEIPLETVSESNISEHWSKKSKRHKMQQFVVRCAFGQYVAGVRLPCKIILTRLSPRKLDDDNLVSCFKWIRDEISDCIFPDNIKPFISKSGRLSYLRGRNDCDSRLIWIYKQETRKEKGIRIEFNF